MVWVLALRGAGVRILLRASIWTQAYDLLDLRGSFFGRKKGISWLHRRARVSL